MLVLALCLVIISACLVMFILHFVSTCSESHKLQHALKQNQFVLEKNLSTTDQIHFSPRSLLRYSNADSGLECKYTQSNIIFIELYFL